MRRRARGGLWTFGSAVRPLLAAALALLEGREPSALLDGARCAPLEVSVNYEVARRLHADLGALERLHARVE